MQQIAQWLEKLGLSDYASRFAENRIDFSVLRDLTDQDLKELGVVLGDRKKLLRAIAELGAVATLPGAERRQVTIMFCDLAGSTELSARFDPEDMRTIIGDYHRCCAEQVEARGGFVAKYMGDGVLAYFGYPEAHEDDAERAVQTGLALADAVPRLATPAGTPLAVRVGIATGLVVIGDLVGAGQAQERSVVGETPNVAARLQALAERNMVAVADDTRRLVGNLFDFDDLGLKDLKGLAGPRQAWAARRARPVENRFEALRAGGSTDLVGRERESELLRQRWANAAGGQGQVVLLSGEAGVGKSRLAAALLEYAGAEAGASAPLRLFSSPQHTSSPFHPIIAELARTAGFVHGDPPATLLDKLDALVARCRTAPGDAALFAELLAVPNDGRYPVVDLAPMQRRQRLLDAVVARIEGLTRVNPVLVIFEDAHWADPTTLEVLGRLAERVPRLRLLLLVTFRPEFSPPWAETSHVARLSLERLDRGDVAALIGRIAGAERLPPAVRQEIFDRTDGIPLFVEEMTKALVEGQRDGETQRAFGAGPSAVRAVPPTLHAFLTARLDRLGPAKETAQVGAAIGREFSSALLAAVMRQPEAELRTTLDRLLAAGLLLAQPGPSGATYMFNHALVQDAAYGSLLREGRRAIHGRIAVALESGFPEIVTTQPELLAHHCSEAGFIERAARLWATAGRRSLARSALSEAAEQFTRALAHIGALPGTTERRREQVRLQVELAHALMHTRGHAAPETQASLSRARSLIEEAEVVGEPPEDPLVLFSVLYGYWVANRMTFAGEVACDLAEQFLELAHKQGAAIPIMIGHLLQGISQLLTGSFLVARANLDRAIALYEPAAHGSLATRFGHDIRVTALSWRAFVLWVLGYPQASLEDAESAVCFARETGHAATLMFALSHTALTLTYCGKHAAARSRVDELVRLADEKAAPYWKTYGLLLRGWLAALDRKAAEAVSLIRSGSAAMRATGATAYGPWYLANLIVPYAQLGQFDDSKACLIDALARVEGTNERWCEAEIHRLAGEAILFRPHYDQAEAQLHFDRALGVARTQRARSFELRAAISLARLWRDHDRRQEARELLARMQELFSQGLDTSDLQDARALLDMLG